MDKLGKTMKRLKSSKKLKDESAVFGKDLEELLELQGQEIPYIVTDTTTWIEKNGRYLSINVYTQQASFTFIEYFRYIYYDQAKLSLFLFSILAMTVEGIFRESPSKTELAALRGLYTKGKSRSKIALIPTFF
jgi:hypothetical protein